MMMMTWEETAKPYEFAAFHPLGCKGAEGIDLTQASHVNPWSLYEMCA